MRHGCESWVTLQWGKLVTRENFATPHQAVLQGVVKFPVLVRLNLRQIPLPDFSGRDHIVLNVFVALGSLL